MGLKGKIPLGGHLIPISTDGDKLEWKKAQKKERKKKISDVINRIIPHRIPKATLKEWCPWNVLSRMTSRHHWIIVKIIVIRPIFIKKFEFKWNHSIIPKVIYKAAKAPVSGQGLTFTKW